MMPTAETPPATVAEVRDAVLSRLGSVGERDGYWLALCPAHEDRNPSLSVREHDDGLSVKCHAGCDTGDVLDAVGLQKKDLFPRIEATLKTRTSPESLATKIAEHYVYQDADGNPLFRVWRTPSKKFIQQRYDAKTGEYRTGLKGIEPVLYRLPEILAADPSEPVYVVEGEKDADRLAGAGFLATTSPMGAGKWRDPYAEPLRGRTVYVLPDNDKPGEAHAKRVFESLSAAGADAKIVRLPDLPPKGDVSDWFDLLGGTPEELRELASRPLAKPFGTITLAELVAREFPPVKWVVPGLIPEGTMLLAGKPKMGKSWMALGLCVAVASGGFALGSVEVEEGDALYLALEDNDRRLKDRALKVLAGDKAPARLQLAWENVGRLDAGFLETLESWLEGHPEARLVVIDTMAKVRSRTNDRRTLYEQDYEVGAELTTLAGRHNVCIILVHHLKKGDADDALDLISGSTGLSGGVDGALVLTRTRSEADAVLKAVHRDLKDDPELALRWDSERTAWNVLGNAEEYRMGKERREIFEFVAREDMPVRPQEVADALGRPNQNIRQLMGKMVEDGYLNRSGEYGKYVAAPNAEKPATLAPIHPDHSSHTNHSSPFTLDTSVTSVISVTEVEESEEF